MNKIVKPIDLSIDSESKMFGKCDTQVGITMKKN